METAVPDALEGLEMSSASRRLPDCRLHEVPSKRELHETMTILIGMLPSALNFGRGRSRNSTARSSMPRIRSRKL